MDKRIQQSNWPEESIRYYGNVIALISFIVVMMGWGIFYIYGVFFNPLMNEFSWSRAETAAACSICIFISGVIGIFAGRLSDKFGPKKIIISCTFILSTGYILMAFIQEIWQFYLIYGVVVAAGVAGFWAPPVTSVAHWFIKRRGLITGIVGGGISFGTLTLAPAVTRLIESVGWRESYLIIGIVVLVIVLVAVPFYRQSPLSNQPLKVSASSVTIPLLFSWQTAIRTRQFWLVCLIYLFFGATHLSIMVHIVPEATGLGISPINASIILSIIGIVGLLGRIVFGVVTDKIRVKPAAIISLAILLTSLIWLQFADNMVKLYVFAVFFGFGYGGISCAQSLLALELFGLSAVGVITAIFSFSFNVGGSIGPVLSGYIYDIQESYRVAFLICLSFVAVALVIAISLRPMDRN